MRTTRFRAMKGRRVNIKELHDVDTIEQVLGTILVYICGDYVFMAPFLQPMDGSSSKNYSELDMP